MTGKIIIITAPSGSGKTSITHYLLQQVPQLTFSVSAATRAPRAHEVDGRDYYFISEEAFKQHIQQNDFVEWEMVYEGKYYGTLKKEIERIWGENKVPILDIDVKGAIHVQKQFAGKCFSIFIQAPSIEDLKHRLEARGTDTPETIAIRVNKAAYEMSFKEEFNAVIINDHLPTAQQETTAIVQTFLNDEF